MGKKDLLYTGKSGIFLCWNCSHLLWLSDITWQYQPIIKLPSRHCCILIGYLKSRDHFGTLSTYVQNFSQSKVLLDICLKKEKLSSLLWVLSIPFRVS